MTSENSLNNPAVTSDDVGLAGEKTSIPYLSTENKSAERQETIDQPKLTNPGSSESMVSSQAPSTMEAIMNSIQNYLHLTSRKWQDIAVYILAIAKYPGGIMGPAIFEEDAGENNTIKAFQEMPVFMEEILKRKVLFLDNRYEQSCLGLYPQVVEKDKMQGRCVPWPFAAVEYCKVPIIILKRTTTPS